MTKKVYLNPDRLDTAINSLTYLADDAETAKTNIDNQFSAEGDPMDPSTDLFTIGNSIETVRGLVSTLTSFKQAILDANNSGVGSMDAGGSITIELSDNASVNSPEQVNACIRAAADATDLAAIQAGKNPKSKRSYEEIMESLRANQDDAAYADGIIDSIGLDALTAFPLRNSEHSSEIAEILGKLLATASTAWSEDRSNEVAEAMVESVDGDQVNEYGRITALNTMLGRHDADGDHVDDLNFNTTFLTSLAEGLGNIDPAAVNVEVHKAGVFSRLGAFIPDVSMDPMAGVLDAMGNNPQAALNYLAPASEDGSVDVSRIDGLSTRDWGQEGLSGFTSALAAASSLRNSTDEAVGERARSLAGSGIHGLAQNTREKSYNDDTKAHIGVLLANCPAEVSSEYLGAGPNDSNKPSDPTLPGAEPDDIKALTYRVADNADATATISTGLANYTNMETQQAIADHEGDTQEQVSQLNNKYTNGARAVGFLAGVADAKAAKFNKQEDADHAKHVSSATSALTAFSTLATAAAAVAGEATGGPIGAVASSRAAQGAASAATTMAAPVLADAITADAEHRQSPMVDDPNQVVWGAAVQQAANNGLLSQENLAEASATSEWSWIKQKGDGTYYIDLTDAAKGDYEHVRLWTEMLKNKSITQGDGATVSSIGDDFEGNYANGSKAGEDYANNG
ncbi:DUF6571 family protein [uncultured Actinomyces sp.]|jgi:hypothetical protein|uniref:DUF6571 family protein n=1 Tax=uncultured Actinomyces sp. TaxID=249061 RepID=UPI0028EEDED9|nr:DUF6571 family protein [uncultured Actinomyces sp.]